MKDLYCESCSYYRWDDELNYYVCMVNLDEDEMQKFINGTISGCSYYQNGDDYQIVRKQM